MAPELSKGKTLVVLAIVIGCFAILWPKIFYPMFQGSVAPIPQHQPAIKERDPAGALCCGVVFESDASSTAFLAELCNQVLKQRDQIPPDRILPLCHAELLNKCGIDLEDVVKSDVDGAVVDRRLRSKFHGRVRAHNLTSCLEVNFGIDENLVRAKKSYHRPTDVFYPRHMRPERPPHLHPDMMHQHPALREKGRVIPPTRTIEKQAKPGPMPGMRPPMGGAGHIVSPSPGSGGMGVLMPIYTIGIIVFFLYTMMKIMFKKPQEDVVEPRIKDFHMDAEHRKYLFAEEYCTGVPGAVPEMTVKEYALLQEQQKAAVLLQQQRKSRSKTPEVFAKKDEELEPLIEEHLSKNEALVEAAQPAEESEEEEIIPRSPKMDTDGKPIGQWYLPPGFDGGPNAGNESENETSHDEIDLNDADERSLRLAFAALKAQKEEEVDQLKRRLEETERAMERICRQMGNVTDKLSTSAVAEMLTPHLTDNKEAEEESVPADAAKTQPVEHDVINEVVQDTNPVEEDVKCQSIPVSQLEEIVENTEECPREICQDIQNVTEAVISQEIPVTTESADLPKVNEIRLEDVESQIVAAVVSSVESAPEQEEESQRQIDETIEEMMKSGQEPAQEESHIDQMIEEMMKSDVEPEEPVESVQEEEVPVKEIQSSIEEIPEKTVEETQVPELVQEETLVQVIAEEDQIESKSEIVQEPTSQSVQEQSAVLEEQVPTKEEELETEVVQESVEESVSVQNVEDNQVEEDVSQVLEPETAQETINVEENPVPEKLVQEESLAQEEIPSKAEEEIQPESDTSFTNVEELVSTPNVETTESESVQGEVSIKEVQHELETEPVQEPVTVETTEVSVESVQESQDEVPVKELETETVQESQVQDEVPVKELETETVQEQIIVETQVSEEAVQESQVQDEVPVKELETETVQEDIVVETQGYEEAAQEPQVQDVVPEKELETETVQEQIIVETNEETQVSEEAAQEPQVQEEVSTKELESETVQEDIVVETQVSEESQVQEEVFTKELESESVEEQIIAETTKETQESCESVEESHVQDEASTKEDQQDTETVQEPISVDEIKPEPVQEVQVPTKEEEIVEEPISSVEKVATDFEQTPVEEHVPEQQDQIQSSVEETLQSQPESVPEPVNQEEETLVETTEENEPETVQEQTIVQEHVPVKEEESQSSIEESLVSETVQESVNTEEDESLQSVETIEEILETEQTIAEDNQLSLPDETSAEEIQVKEQVHPQVEQSSLVCHGSEERKMTVNVCSMDVTTSMADHGKMPTDLLPKITHHPHRFEESAEIPSVFLDTSIPPESHLVVTEAECSAQAVPAEDLDLDANEYETSPVVLSGKMTLSVIGMELSADAPELQIEPKVEEPDAPRVRFPPQPTDRIFLIPVEPEEELIPEDPNDTHLQDRVEDEDEMVDDSAVIYRPPTPPLQHLNEQDAEFLTYDQLEEVGEADVIIPEVPQVKRLDSIPDADEEEVEEFWSKDSGVDQTLLDSVESHIISTEEAEALNEKNVPVASEHIEQIETVPAVNDEHVSIGEMAEKIRVAMEESVAQEPEVVEQQSAIVEEDTTNEEEINIPSSIQSALSEMVDNIISASIAGSVVEALRREECDNETVIVAQVSEPDSLEQSVSHQLAERINLLSDSGTDSVLMDVEYQLIPSSDSVTGTDNGEQDQVEEDFERNSEVTEMEHALEQVEKQEELPTVVTEAEEEEPSISGFIIREDFPEDEETEPMTEEEILQARQEIEEIKKLLADVSSGVVHQTGQESSNIVSELAYAMAEDAAVAAATSKGSSPDMDEYEVIQTARPTETSEDGEKTRSTNTTSTTNDS